MKSVKKFLVNSLLVASLLASTSVFSFTISAPLYSRPIAYVLSAAGLTVFMTKKQIPGFINCMKHQGVLASFRNHNISLLGFEVASILLLLDAARQQRRLEQLENAKNIALVEAPAIAS